MKKKLPGVFQPSIKLYFVFTLVFAASTFFIGGYSKILAVVEVAALIALALYTRVSAKNRAEALLQYLESISGGIDSTVRDTPLPVAIFNMETGDMLWSNERFISAVGGIESLFEIRIAEAVPGFTWRWLSEGKNECPELVALGARKYRVYGSVSDRVATTYWMDVTEYENISAEFQSSRTILAILMLDNYEELLKGMSEKEKSILLSDIDEKINLWADDSNGYLCRYDRDRYIFMFEERYLEGFVADKFSVLDSVRENVGAGVHATLSVGVGKDGKTPLESFRFASLAVEMALSRGGDQAVIRNRYGFEFFGGHSPQLEKRTKVKSRVMASAFGELLSDAGIVYVMGHKFSDFDSIGAAAGVCCIARAKGKTARIVVDTEASFATGLISRLSGESEYKGTFVTPQDAILEADSKSLLVVVDTSRPEKVESETLLLSCTRVAVIDHHRRAVTYIDNAILNFHEPYASSAAELVTEMMQYLVDTDEILRVEAEALLAGIVLDTKSFAIHTGSRTFEAAAFLRRAGADTADIKKLMQSDFETATARYSIMQSAAIYKAGIALATSDMSMSRISIAQAADELLNIQGVRASFVVARSGGDIFASGRSIGNVNVQVILEKLGGGGNQSTAGVQIPGAELSQVLADLKDAIDEYLEDDGSAQFFDRR